MGWFDLLVVCGTMCFVGEAIERKLMTIIRQLEELGEAKQ